MSSISQGIAFITGDVYLVDIARASLLVRMLLSGHQAGIHNLTSLASLSL